MKIKNTLFGLIMGVSLLASSQAQSAAYMKLGDIKGESQDDKHIDWINLLSVNWGVSRDVDTATRQSGPPIPDQFESSKELDKSSPKLQEACVVGTVIPLVEVEFTRSYGATGAREVYLRYELKNVLISSYSISASGYDGEVPEETFSLYFDEIRVIYSERDSTGKLTGTVETTWNVQKGTT